MLAKKKQTFLIFLGIGFGTMIYIIVAGLQLGMRAYMVEQLLNNTAHILISGEEKYIEKDFVENHLYPDEMVSWVVPPSGKREEGKLGNPQGWFEVLDNTPQVLSYSPRLNVQAIASNTQYSAGISLLGIIPQKQIKISSLEDYMQEGSILDVTGGTNTIILSHKLLKKLGAKMGSTINLSNGVDAPLPFKVVGIIKLGNNQLDETFALSHLKDVQKLNKTPGRITEIAVALYNMDLATPLAKRWKLLSRDQVQGWQEANQNLMEMIKIQDLFRYIITVTVLLVSGFGIYNVLSIMINQKQKEIAILRSVGFSKEKILQLFLSQGLLLGIAGGILGNVLGLILCKIIGSIEFSFEIGKSNNLWVSYDYLIYVTGFCAAVCSSLIAGVIPSYSASKLTPLEIIREHS